MHRLVGLAGKRDIMNKLYSDFTISFIMQKLLLSQRKKENVVYLK